MSQTGASCGFGPSEPTRQVGDLRFVETSDWPFILKAGESLPHSGPVLAVTTQEYTLEQAETMVPFPIRLPQWMPDGFVRDAGVRLAVPPPPTDTTDPILLPAMRALKPSAHLMWRRADGAYIGFDLRVVPFPAVSITHALYQGMDTLSEVRVHGAPAALISSAEGATPERRAVFPHARVRLLWQRGDVLYKLHAPGGHISAQELLRIAESVPS
jgi:hypothetical protein